MRKQNYINLITQTRRSVKNVITFTINMKRNRLISGKLTSRVYIIYTSGQQAAGRNVEQYGELIFLSR
jgi:hypothetical protein